MSFLKHFITGLLLLTVFLASSAAKAKITSSYGYNAHNRLESAAEAGTGTGTSLTLSYDPTGRLSRSTLNNAATDYVYSGDKLIGEHQSGSLVKLYVYPPHSDIPIARLGATAPLSDMEYLHADERGSIVAVTDDTGPVESHQYDVYGVPLDQSDSLFRYTGQIQLRGTDLYHYKARAYHPGLGRFLQTDPIGYDDGMNLYAYVGNDPVNSVDPNGKTAIGIKYNFYMVNTGYGFNAPLGHKGVLLVDDRTGKTKYYEFGRYSPQSRGIVGAKLPKNEGNIRNEKVPDAKIGEDGKPTEASLKKIYDYLSDNVGKGTSITADVHLDQDAAKVEESILNKANNPDRQKYDLLRNNCKDFVDDTVNNPKTKYDK